MFTCGDAVHERITILNDRLRNKSVGFCFCARNLFDRSSNGQEFNQTAAEIVHPRFHANDLVGAIRFRVLLDAGERFLARFI